jgi:5'(3')-deoxyribonucleotidase
MPASSCQKAIRLLIEHYQVYFVAPADDKEATETWLEEYINVPAWHHAVYTYRRDLLYGDYIIQTAKTESMATPIEYGSDTFKTWDDVINYFSHLGGQ